MKKIKVVFGINDLLVGGMQRQFVQQIRHFDRQRFDITLITLFTFKDRPTLYKALPGDLALHRLAFSGWWDAKEWWRLYRLLRTLKPDIAVSSLFFSNTVFRLLKPLLGYASIAREHNTYIDKSRLQKLFDRLLARFSYRVVAVSKTVADFTAAQENIPKEKFTIIHNGIDLQEAAHALMDLPDKDILRQEMGLAADDFVVLNVARLSAQKNHKLLMEGFALFAKHNPKARLLIVGDGGLRQQLEAQAQGMGLSDRVQFLGMQERVWRFYKVADVVASASSIEGFSNVYLEAFAAGLPLAATLTAGTDEFLVEGENGCVIAEQNPQAVAAALGRVQLLDEEERRHFAYRTAEYFSIKQTVSNYEKLFSQAVQ